MDKGMFYVRDEYLVPATIYAETVEPTRVWAPGQGFMQDPAYTTGLASGWPIPGRPVRITLLQVWVLDVATKLLKRGTMVGLVNLTEPAQSSLFPAPNRPNLRTMPLDGIQGQDGIRYDGPGFLCVYAVGWCIRSPALAAGDFVNMRIGWEGV